MGSPEQKTDTTKDYDTSKFLESIKETLPKENKEEYLLKQIATLEKRRRDTQAAFTKAQQEALRLKAERELLAKKVRPEVKDEDLETLKFEDPDKWREEITKREREYKQKLQEELNVSAEEATKQFELEERKRIFRSFVEANPDIDITSPEVQDQIPPKYIKQLETGNISFEGFLTKVKKFIETPKVVGGEIPEVPDVNLKNIPGDSKPKKATGKSLVEQYDNLIF